MPDPLKVRSKYEEILANHNRVLRWLQSGEGVLLRDWFQEIQDNCRHKLTREKEPTELFRLQGRMMLAEELVKLHDELQQYGKDVASGKRKAL